MMPGLLCRAIPTARLRGVMSHTNDTATDEIYTLSLHDALPIWSRWWAPLPTRMSSRSVSANPTRSEEHTSELQSQFHLVCRLLLEKINEASYIRSSPLLRLLLWSPFDPLTPHYGL